MPNSVLLLISLIFLTVGVALSTPAFGKTTFHDWEVFCSGSLQGPVDICADHEPEFHQITDESWYVIKTAFYSMKRLRTSWEPDGEDVWQYPHADAKYIDCEDASIFVINELVANGIERGALRIDIVKTWLGYHTVVVLNTTEGELEIDILRKDVRRDMMDVRSDVRKRQINGLPSLWVNVK